MTAPRGARTVTLSMSPPTDRPLEIVIVEDLRDVREGLAVLINGTPGFRCARSFRE